MSDRSLDLTCGMGRGKFLSKRSLEGIYRPLKKCDREIRLLHILPGHRSSSMKCVLSVTSLNDIPEYEALSYVWGSKKDVRKSIRLCNQPLKVGQNLFSALRGLRLIKSIRVLWVDALCIDQDDRKERGQQVSLMGDIYRGAVKVVAWLDHDPVDCSRAFDVVEAFSDFPDLHLDDRVSPHHDSRILDVDSSRSLMRFLDCTWWKRTWTFQEMALAKTLEIRCGDRSLPGEKLAAAHDHFWSHQTCCYSAYAGEYPGDPLADLDKYFGRLARIYDFANLTEDILFPAMMVVFRQRQCTDPRDKVYGYLGLAFGRFRGFIQPVYETAVRDVFEETAFKIMKNIDSLGPLSLLEGPRTLQIGAPTWVPTWEEFADDFLFEAYHIRLKWLIEFNACRKKPLEIDLVSPGRLRVRGVIVDQVARVGKVPPHHPIKHQTAIYDRWYALAQCSESLVYRDSESTQEEAFWLTLLNGSFHGNSGQPPTSLDSASIHRQDSADPAVSTDTVTESIGEDSSPDTILDVNDIGHWRKWWSFMHSHSDYLDIDALTVNTCVTAATVNRSFFVTAGDDKPSNGRMGTGPPSTKPGDLVVVLYGGLVPYVIRPTKSVTVDLNGVQTSAFEVLGDCYLHGIMHGEAIDQLDAGIYEERNFVLV